MPCCGTGYPVAEIVLAAVAQDGVALVYASEKLKGDKEVVLAAVRQNGDALGYASEELQIDKEVVLAAVAQNGGGRFFARRGNFRPTMM